MQASVDMYERLPFTGQLLGLLIGQSGGMCQPLHDRTVSLYVGEVLGTRNECHMPLPSLGGPTDLDQL